MSPRGRRSKWSGRKSTPTGPKGESISMVEHTDHNNGEQGPPAVEPLPSASLCLVDPRRLRLFLGLGEAGGRSSKKQWDFHVVDGVGWVLKSWGGAGLAFSDVGGPGWDEDRLADLRARNLDEDSHSKALCEEFQWVRPALGRRG